MSLLSTICLHFFVDLQVDVFSFGIVLWEILTGEEPYANMHYGAIIGLTWVLFLVTVRVVLVSEDFLTSYRGKWETNTVVGWYFELTACVFPSFKLKILVLKPKSKTVLVLLIVLHAKTFKASLFYWRHEELRPV